MGFWNSMSMKYCRMRGMYRLKWLRNLAEEEYEKFRSIQDKAFESDFDKLVEETKKKKKMADTSRTAAADDDPHATDAGNAG